MTFLGLLALIDPPRRGAAEAIAARPGRRHPGGDDHRR